MKKLLALLLALVMVLPLVGCGGKVSIDEEKLNNLFNVSGDEFTGIRVYYKGKLGYNGLTISLHGDGNNSRPVPFTQSFGEQGLYINAHITYEKSAPVLYTFNLTIYHLYYYKELGASIWTAGRDTEYQIIVGNQKYTITSIQDAGSASSTVNYISLGTTGGEMLKEICSQTGTVKVRATLYTGTNHTFDVETSAFKEALQVWNDYESIGGTTQNLSSYNRNVKVEKVGN